MIKLEQSLQAWATPDFAEVLKRELTKCAAQLPLQQALSASSSVTADPITVVIQKVNRLENMIRVKVGIFFTGAVGGCSCVDDPTPENYNTEYCEVQLEIDWATADTSVTLLND